MRYIRHMKTLGVFEKVMGRCFPLYLTDSNAMWFRRLKTNPSAHETELVNRFMKQFRVLVSRRENTMMLSSVKQRVRKILRSYLTRFNAVTATVHKPNPSVVLMAAFSRVASKIDFKINMKRDPPVSLVEFYHEAERYLRQKDAEIEKVEVNDLDVGEGCQN